MLIELLNTPERRATIGPELVKFFELHVADWRRVLELYLRTFAGTSFDVPGPEFLEQIRRDESIIRALRDDQTPEAVVGIILEHKVTYAHIAQIWQAVTGKMLEAPRVVGRHEAIDAAARLAKAHPRIAADIVAMYQLSAKDHAWCMEIVDEMRRRRVSDPKELKGTAKIDVIEEEVLRQVTSEPAAAPEIRERIARVFRPINQPVPTTARVMNTLNALAKGGKVQKKRGTYLRRKAMVYWK